ncbi:MAG TPA: HDOD domain-containing protein [Tepidisphaeraceae bacterium]|nr:HDOD domain-containing protein [Tepidisphaeraceae bacterium]
MDRKLLDRIRECPTLPSLPAVALKVLELTQSAEFDLTDVARLLSKDPALSSKILRTVNSSFYGNGHTVSTISQALVLLGSQAVRTLVIGFSLGSNLSKNKSGSFDRATYWRRAVYAATASRLICERMHLIQTETCFLAALLMDIGMLAMDQVLGEEYGAITARALSHGDLPAIEAQTLGLTHAQVAGMLAQQWKFPLALQVPMEHHHEPQEVKDSLPRQLTEIVALAGRCADVFVDKGPMWALADARRMALELLKIDEAGCDQLLKEVGQRTAELAPLFEVKIDPHTNYDTVIREANEKLLQISKEGAQETHQHERRRAPRIKKESDVFILPCLGGVVRQSVKVRLMDVSARGIGFTAEKPMEKGDQFIFQTKKADGTPMTLLYETVRCDKNAKGILSIGAELVCVLNDGKKPAPKLHAAGTAEKISKAVMN